MSSAETDSWIGEFSSLRTDWTERNKPTVVGLYGLPGSGKSFLLKELQAELGDADFAFVEGLEKIASLVPGGLEAFHELDGQCKAQIRAYAIDQIAYDSARSVQASIVAGHYMFWPEEHTSGRRFLTSNDLDSYSHIIYLNTPAHVILQRCLKDTLRSQPFTSMDHLKEWQEKEVRELRLICRENRILFSLLSDPDTPDPQIHVSDPTFPPRSDGGRQ